MCNTSKCDVVVQFVSGKGNFSATFSAKLHLQQRNKRQNGAIETFLLLFWGGQIFGVIQSQKDTHTGNYT
jgi:hypothetical protein